ncbi:MAG: transcriptional repressor [Synergistaceae bacterium]|jgi:Fur family peroxide stress response transcriptional regulator|nr:transcriptional repressor [Synergistaceae bacterium]
MLTVDKGVKYLQSAGAKITATRIAILKSLENRRDHPSAERIFMELKLSYPSLSIATVYSTASLLARGSLIRILSIDEKKVYYDPNMEPHGHFMCRQCKLVFDVPFHFDITAAADASEEIASVEDAEVFYYGLCVRCAPPR